MLVILLLSYAVRASGQPPSPLSCSVAVEVKGAGQAEVNGLYHEDVGTLSADVPYYYKWTASLNDYVLLFLEFDTETKQLYWALQSLTQYNNEDFVYYFIDNTKDAQPPTTGWVGKAGAPTTAIGSDPAPSVSLLNTGEIWDDDLKDCARDCSKISSSSASNCSSATVQGAGSAHVNQVFLQTQFVSDCVPYYMTVGVTPALVMFRDWYQMKSYWTIQDVNQEAAETFQEWYGIEPSTSVDPPATGWVSTSSESVGKAPHPTVVFSDKCSADLIKKQQQLPTEIAAKPGTDSPSASVAGTTKLQISVVLAFTVHVLAFAARGFDC